jgi:hypothetical protein
MSETEQLRIKTELCRELFKRDPRSTAAPEVLGVENVLGVAITEKTRDGRPTGERALTLFVREKVEDTDRIDPAWNVTQRYSDLTTDVKEIVQFTAYQVLCGMGVQASGPRGTGGLRVKGKLKSGGVEASHLVGAAHVFRPQGNELHWSRITAGPAEPTWLGHVVAHSDIEEKKPNLFDIGLATLDGTLDTGPKLHCSQAGQPTAVGPAKVGDSVWKCGAQTDFTRGTVEDTDLCCWVYFPADAQWAFFHEQILIRNFDDAARFAEPGDSGSGVAKDRQWVGLFFAGTPTGYFLANPLGPALDSLLQPGWKVET